MKNHLIHATLTGLLLAGLNTQAATLLQDDFSSGTASTTFRMYENEIDTGWRKAVGYGGHTESSWQFTGGQAENASSLAATGYPNNKEAEAPLYNVFSGGSEADIGLSFSFTYSVPAGDTLYAHLWGVTGVSDLDGQFLGNIEGAANGNMPGDNTSDELTIYNLLDGASSGYAAAGQAISGPLTGSGTFSAEFSIASLGVTGVDRTDDFNYFVIAFTQEEDGTAGTLIIDNVSFLSVPVPEPSTLALLGLGAMVLRFSRRRPGRGVSPTFTN